MEFVTLILLFVQTTGQLQFDLDWAVFHHQGDSSRMEFYYGVNFDQLTFQPTENYLVARFQVQFQMRGLDNQFVESGTVFKQARIKNFQEALVARRAFVDQFSVIAPSGQYEIKTDIVDSMHTGSIVDTITVPNFGQQLMLSSLQLGAALVTDTTTGGFGVIPNPGRRFISGKDRKLYAYFEVYGLVADSSSYELRYYLWGADKHDTIFSSPVVKRVKVKSKSTMAVELLLDTLRPGNYYLAVEAIDPTTGQTTQMEKALKVIAEYPSELVTTPYQFKPNPREQRYYRELQYVTTPKEFAYYNALSDSGKEAYLAWFWSKHNLTEFVRRMETADMRFRTVRTPGVQTDRGRIYVKYGEPDAIERKTMEMDIKPREYWFYYQQGLTFIFIDLRGDGNYRLAWSNSSDEPQTGLENFLTPEEQNQYR